MVNTILGSPDAEGWESLVYIILRCYRLTQMNHCDSAPTAESIAIHNSLALLDCLEFVCYI